MPEKKPKREIARRDAGANRFQLPEREPRERDASFVGDLLTAAHTQETTLPSQTRQTSLTTPASQGGAPMRDFAKVPNSLTRVSIPAGEFKGKSKQLYDALYSLTRGAVTPKRAVRISRPQLMKKAGIGARVTFETNIAHLGSIGLIQVRQIPGEHDGNEYTVFLPEERTMPSQSSQSSPTSQGRHAQDQDRLVRLESSQSRHTLSIEDSTTSGDPKTSFKTKEEGTDDDVPAPGLILQLQNAERELTGKVSSSEKWDDLAQLLIAELKIAAARTTVSNVPAFLAEHLRRRLWKVDKKQAAEMASDVEQGSEAAGTLTDEERRACPDCLGVGFWYPDGPDKGVAKCKHAHTRLKATLNI